MKRHFTITAFVSAQGHTLLHWHARNRMWLPPGGHLEADEDPLQALHREVDEETGLRVTLLSTGPRFPYDRPSQLPVPATIMVEDIPPAPHEPAHQHLDLVYFTTPQAPGRPDPPRDGWSWVSADDLRADRPIPPTPDATPVHVPEDVRVLSLAAIDLAAIDRTDPEEA